MNWKTTLINGKTSWVHGLEDLMWRWQCNSKQQTDSLGSQSNQNTNGIFCRNGISKNSESPKQYWKWRTKTEDMYLPISKPTCKAIVVKTAQFQLRKHT